MNRANLLRIIRREAPAFGIRFTGYWADARKSPKFIDGKSMKFRITSFTFLPSDSLSDPTTNSYYLPKQAALLGSKVYGLTGANHAITCNLNMYGGKTYYIEFTL